MTSVVLLEQLKAFTEKIMADMILPVAMQQGDTEQAYRAPEVYPVSYTHLTLPTNSRV